MRYVVKVHELHSGFHYVIADSPEEARSKFESGDFTPGPTSLEHVTEILYIEELPINGVSDRMRGCV